MEMKNMRFARSFHELIMLDALRPIQDYTKKAKVNRAISLRSFKTFKKI